MSLDIWLYVEVNTGVREHSFQVYESNITHNLTPMWDRAGCYDALYMREGDLAEDILPAVEAARIDMEADPAAYKALNPSNGWGDYEGALDFLRGLEAACREHPKAKIGVCK